MKIDIRYVAGLAKLRFDEDELPRMQKELELIAGMVDGLPTLEDMRMGPDTTHEIILRTDEPERSVGRDALFSNAPQVQAGCIVVPKTL